MAEHGQGPRSGSRDNGLRCAGYVAVGDLDPRVADDLLETLRAEGIAAYVSPTPGARGGYLEVTLPARTTDRLYADSTRAERASELLARAPQAAGPDAAPEREIDFESAWQQLLGSLQSSGTTGAAQWPAAEGLGAEGLGADGLEPSTPVPVELPADPFSLPIGGDPAMDDHFIPPPPPPLPRLRRVTVMSLLSILAGLVILGTNLDGGSLVWLGVLAILAGGAALIYHVKEGPPPDSGWDDGAVV
jgi:hypothetical protein